MTRSYQLFAKHHLLLLPLAFMLCIELMAHRSLCCVIFLHCRLMPSNPLSVFSSQPTSLNTRTSSPATRFRSPWAPQRLGLTTWDQASWWASSATPTCSCRTSGRSTCARWTPACRRRGDDADNSGAVWCTSEYQLTVCSTPPHTARSLSTGTCSGTSSRWSSHVRPRRTSSRSAWSCRSFSRSSLTPARGRCPRGAPGPTLPRRRPSSTLRRGLRSFVSLCRRRGCFSTGCCAWDSSQTDALLRGRDMICNY